ncbi:leucine-rich repeat protein [Perkinsela sp. CCAP 1560/4]|nr:leucine-rich repeat protein [Perkinsela sp. CCAP 1560/4]|eukprot:KNH07983.1 leucine-rich repeat protein [Perkinsela sp. CCAP 1560/4]
MFYLPAFALADDSGIFRVDRSTLSHQVLIEILFSNLARQSKMYDANGDFKEIKSLECIELDSNGDVVTVDLFYRYIRGNLDVQCLPDTVVKFNFSFNQLHGALECSRLPTALLSAFASSNRLSGEIDLPRLPPLIKCFEVKRNKFSGTLDFSEMPTGILWLSLAQNSLDGKIDLSMLKMKIAWTGKEGPPHVAWANPVLYASELLSLDLSDNQFSGDIGVREIKAVKGDRMFGQLACSEIVDLTLKRRTID